MTQILQHSDELRGIELRVKVLGPQEIPIQIPASNTIFVCGESGKSVSLGNTYYHLFHDDVSKEKLSLARE
jgi:hypothetical protein